MLAAAWQRQSGAPKSAPPKPPLCSITAMPGRKARRYTPTASAMTASLRALRCAPILFFTEDAALSMCHCINRSRALHAAAEPVLHAAQHASIHFLGNKTQQNSLYLTVHRHNESWRCRDRQQTVHPASAPGSTILACCICMQQSYSLAHGNLPVICDFKHAVHRPRFTIDPPWQCHLQCYHLPM